MTMRKVRLVLAAALLAAGIQAASPSPSHAVTRISANIDFYDALAPYGSWEHVSRYGDCWVPLDTPVGWRPYTAGYWVDTDYGWMWISDDPWGGIPYHYGRWAYDRYYGWVWVPDDDLVWAPAWVAWRYGDDYVGWAPLPPDAGWSGSGLTISVSTLDRRINRSGWCFAPVRTFGTTRIRSSLLSPSRNVTFLARTRNVTRYEVYNSLPAERGLRPEIIQRATGRNVPRYQVVDSRSSTHLRNVAIQGRTIEVYRPRITGARTERVKFERRGNRGLSRATIQRQGAEQRRFDDRMRQERTVLQREHQRELRQESRAGARQDQMRQRQQEEMTAQREREAQERRSLDQRRKIAEGAQRDQGQGAPQRQGRGQRESQRQRQPRDQAQDQRQDRGQPQAQDQTQDQGKGQTQDDQNKGHGRGRGHDKGGN